MTSRYAALRGAAQTSIIRRILLARGIDRHRSVCDRASSDARMTSHRAMDTSRPDADLIARPDVDHGRCADLLKLLDLARYMRRAAVDDQRCLHDVARLVHPTTHIDGDAEVLRIIDASRTGSPCMIEHRLHAGRSALLTSRAGRSAPFRDIKRLSENRQAALRAEHCECCKRCDAIDRLCTTCGTTERSRGAAHCRCDRSRIVLTRASTAIRRRSDSMQPVADVRRRAYAVPSIAARANVAVQVPARRMQCYVPRNTTRASTAFTP